MGHVNVTQGQVQLQQPVFIEGLPGLGLVGKIATDHLIERFGMTYYAGIECPSLPAVASYRDRSHEPLPPVRVFADEQRDLLALQSDVAVSPETVSDFATCLSNFLVEHDALPVISTGLGRVDESSSETDRSLYGIATSDGAQILTGNGIQPPPEEGLWQGPTGALIEAARKHNFNSVGLIVETTPHSPDPEAAVTLIEDGFAPILGMDIDVDPLHDRAARIQEAAKPLADEMREPSSNESSKAESLRMYH